MADVAPLPCGWRPERRQGQYILASFRKAIADCYQGYEREPHIAPLAAGARNLVPGAGSITPRAILVGGAPGAMEDRSGLPFQGPAGQLLDKTLSASGMAREQFWMTSVVKFRPGGNRAPDDREVAESLPYLGMELSIIGGPDSVPGCRLAVALGRTAASALAGRQISVLASHGLFFPVRVAQQKGWVMFVTFSPDDVLRDGKAKRFFTEDIRRLAAELGQEEGAWPRFSRRRVH